MCSLMLHKSLHLKMALNIYPFNLVHGWLISHDCNRIKASQLSYDLSSFLCLSYIHPEHIHSSMWNSYNQFASTLWVVAIFVHNPHSICYLILGCIFFLCWCVCSYFQINATHTHKSQLFHLLLAVWKISNFSTLPAQFHMTCTAVFFFAWYLCACAACNSVTE